jgi:hypothetical protein
MLLKGEHMSHQIRNRVVGTLVTGFSLLACHGAVADVKPDPGDYTGLPAGTDLLVMYAQAVRADDAYVHGTQVASNLGVSVDVGILRYVHFTKWGDFIVDPQVIVPFGHQKVDASKSSSSGLGDVIFGGTLWTTADLKSGEHLGYSLFITAPTGNDKDSGYLLSQNRWAADLQAGYIRKLADKWTMDLVAETEFYGDQRTTNVKTDDLYQAYAHLRYHVSDATHVAASYRHAWGAGQKNPDGSVLAGRKNDDNLMLTWASFLTKQWQLQLQYQQDLHVENTLKGHGVQGRLLYAF